MRFRIDFKLNNGRTEAPAFEEDVQDIEELADAVCDEWTSDHGPIYGPGATLTIERIA